jgi:hypothetical protein
MACGVKQTKSLAPDKDTTQTTEEEFEVHGEKKNGRVEKEKKLNHCIFTILIGTLVFCCLDRRAI